MKNKIINYSILAFVLIIFLIAGILVYEKLVFLPAPFFGALIGVVITAVVTFILLHGQTEGEAQKDKDIKIYKEKIRIYSKFTSEVWNLLPQTEFINDKILEESQTKLKELRTLCFKKLVFYLNGIQVRNISEHICKINECVSSKESDYNDDKMHEAIAEINEILKSDLDSNKNKTKKKDEKIQKGELKSLYRAFSNLETSGRENQTDPIFDKTQQLENPITFWHFNMLEDKQIEAFKNNNWVLNLVEYGEDWRTNALLAVQPKDVVFLFRRGGYGYIGAFRVIDNKVLYKKEFADGKYTKEVIQKYDIYNRLDDDADLSSNLIVMPIAYNYKGVGYLTVRRRTIERMNDMGTVKFLLNRFNGKDLDETQRAGMGKLDENSSNLDLDTAYFDEIKEKYLE